jgi:crossover junction endodeoxyribonuclease RuvC
VSKVLGIDPGLATTGYGIVEEKGNKLHLINYGTIRTKSQDSFPARLKSIYNGIKGIIKQYKVNISVIEDCFFSKENIKTAFLIGQVRGVALLACVDSGLEIASYTPLQAKQAIVGYGRATKDQVQQMIKILLNLKEIPEPPDAADALAVAICHLHTTVNDDILHPG